MMFPSSIEIYDGVSTNVLYLECVLVNIMSYTLLNHLGSYIEVCPAHSYSLHHLGIWLLSYKCYQIVQILRIFILVLLQILAHGPQAISDV